MPTGSASFAGWCLLFVVLGSLLRTVAPFCFPAAPLSTAPLAFTNGEVTHVSSKRRSVVVGSIPFTTNRRKYGGDNSRALTSKNLAALSAVRTRDFGDDFLEPSQAPYVQSAPGRLGVFEGRFQVVQMDESDIDKAAQLCISVFFGTGDSPWKQAQLRQLFAEQKNDLAERCIHPKRHAAMYKAIDMNSDDKNMVGFIEIMAMPGSKYGMGEGIAEIDRRPVVSNLAVHPNFRRFGIGSGLVEVCEATARGWGFKELVLQVEEENWTAQQFYRRLNFHPLFMDRAARRYDTSGFLLQNVRTSKLTMRKVLPAGGPVRTPIRYNSGGSNDMMPLFPSLQPVVTGLNNGFNWLLDVLTVPSDLDFEL